VVGVAGLFVAPAMTTAYLLAEESATPGFRTRAGAWVNTAFNAGSSIGMAAIGRLPLWFRPALPATSPWSWCFAAAPPLILALVALARRVRCGEPARRGSPGRGVISGDHPLSAVLARDPAFSKQEFLRSGECERPGSDLITEREDHSGSPPNRERGVWWSPGHGHRHVAERIRAIAPDMSR